MRVSAKTVGGLLSLAVFGVTTIQSARTTFKPQPPDPGLLDLLLWVSNGNDILAAFTALAAGIAAGWSIWQMFQPSPATPDDVRDAVTDDGVITRNSFTAQHSATLSAISRDKHQQTLEDIRDGTCSPEEIEAFRDALLGQVSQSGEEEAKRFANTVVDLATSEDSADRDIAISAFEGDPIAAADRLMLSVATGRRDAADRSLKAARIYAPFARAKAIGAYAQAVELDSDNASAWIDLANLHLSGDSVAAARRCLERAAQVARARQDHISIKKSLGDVLRQEGELDMARASYQQGAEESQRWIAEGTAPLEIELGLQMFHVGLGDIADWQTDYVEARRQYESARQIGEELWNRRPESTTLLREMGVAYMRLGDLEFALDNFTQAQIHFRLGLTVAEALNRTDSGNWLWQRDLIIGNNRLGEASFCLGMLAEAEQRFQTGFEVTRTLLATEPDNLNWQRDLSISHESLGLIAEANNRRDEALEYFTTSLYIRIKILRADGGTLQSKYSVASAWIRLAGIAEKWLHKDQAGAHYREALSIYRETDLGDSTNRVQANLFKCLFSLGDIALSYRRFAEACEHFVAAKAVVQQQLDHDTDSFMWLRRLPVCENRLASVAQDAGRLSEARQLFESGLAASRRIVHQFPKEPEAWRDVIYALYCLGDLEMARHNIVAARQDYEEARQFVDRIANVETDESIVESCLGLYERKLSYVAWREGNLPLAHRHIRDAVRHFERATVGDANTAHLEQLESARYRLQSIEKELLPEKPLL